MHVFIYAESQKRYPRHILKEEDTVTKATGRNVLALPSMWCGLRWGLSVPDKGDPKRGPQGPSPRLTPRQL